MKNNKRRQPAGNRFFTGVINAVLLSIAWWAIIAFFVINISGL